MVHPYIPASPICLLISLKTCDPSRCLPFFYILDTGDGDVLLPGISNASVAWVRIHNQAFPNRLKCWLGWNMYSMAG